MQTVIRIGAVGLWCCGSVITLSLFVCLVTQRDQVAANGQEVFPQTATLIINEYLADPPTTGGDANGDGVVSATNDEFVELVNNGAAPLDVGLFTISDSTSVRFTFPPGKIIPAGEAAVVFGGGTPTGSFGNAAANGLVFAAGGGGLSLNNTGDSITVKDGAGTLVATLTFGSTEGNADQSITRSPDVTGAFIKHSTATGSDGTLFSPGARVDGTAFAQPNPIINSINPSVVVAGAGSLPITISGSHFQTTSKVKVDGAILDTSFQSVTQLIAVVTASTTGVPGAHLVVVENPGSVQSNAKTFTVLPFVGINEYLADPPDGAAGDANGDGTRDSSQDEFVEIINRSSIPANVGGFTISDADSVRFTFPTGAVIPANEVAVIFGGGSPTGDFGNARANGLIFTAPLSLNNGGDMITLKNSGGSVIESIIFGAIEGGANQSITRSPDATGDFIRHSIATGGGGALFSPGTRVDGMLFTAARPVVASISPDSGIEGVGPNSIAVTGTQFDSAANILVDGFPIATTFQSAMHLTAAVPPSVIGVRGVHQVSVENPGSVRSNSVALTILSAIGINEYLADPPGSSATDLAGDANHDGVRDSAQDEFIEIINRTGDSFDISGYSISDSDAQRFVFPIGTILPANECAVLFGGGTPTGEFGNAGPNGLVFTAALSLNNGGDVITLRNGAGVTLESITVGATEGSAGQSINRNPEVAGLHFERHSGIAGSAGRLFSPGTMVDGSAFTFGPRITSLTPDAASKNAAPFEMTVEGSGFDGGSQVFIDSIPIETALVGPVRLRVQVSVRVTSISGNHTVQVRNGGGNRSNLALLKIIPPPPIISRLLPKFVVLGTGQFTMFVSGANFDAPSAVLIEGLAVPTKFVNEFELTATVGSSFVTSLGTKHVVIRNGEGKHSNEDRFEVISPLTILTSLFPTNIIAGSGEISIAVRGTNFKNASVVQFDQTNLVTSFASQSQLLAVIPAHLLAVPGVHSVSVRTSDEPSANDLVFQVLPNPPLLFAIEPSSIIEGAGEVQVSISGAKFQNGSVVRVLDERSRGTVLDTTFVSATGLQARIPESMTATSRALQLAVENPDFGLSNAIQFNVLIKDPLIINEYLADPPEGLAGDANGDGTRSSSSDEFVEILNRTNQPLDISGYKLSDADALRHVFAQGTVIPPFEVALVFGGGTPVGSFGNAAENHLVFKASSGGLSLNNGGDSIILQDSQNRIIQRITFGSMEGGAGQSINRDPDGDGSGFSFHTKVAHDANSLFSPGRKVSGDTFTVKPVIQQISPASVRAGSAQFLLSISGSKFVPGAVVVLGVKLLETTFVSESRLEALVPPDLVVEGGSAEVRVQNPRGELSTPARLLILDDPPRISHLDPPTVGTGADNLEVTISGERFQRGAITFVNDRPVETRFVSLTEVVATLPSSLFTKVAELNIQIQNADLNRSNTVSLNVENGPLITRLSKARIRAGRGAVELTVGGVSFQPGIMLYADEVALQTSFINDVELRVRIPENLTSEPRILSLRARAPNGGRSNEVKLKIVP